MNDVFRLFIELSICPVKYKDNPIKYIYVKIHSLKCSQMLKLYFYISQDKRLKKICKNHI